MTFPARPFTGSFIVATFLFALCAALLSDEARAEILPDNGFPVALSPAEVNRLAGAVTLVCGSQSLLAKERGDDYVASLFDEVGADTGAGTGVDAGNPETTLDAVFSHDHPAGHGERVLCGAGDREQRRERFELEQLRRLAVNSRGEQRLSALEDGEDSVRLADFWLPASGTWHQPAGGGDTWLYVGAFRTRGAAVDTSLLHEVHTVVRKRGAETRLERRFYVNGFLAGWLSWVIS